MTPLWWPSKTLPGQAALKAAFAVHMQLIASHPHLTSALNTARKAYAACDITSGSLHARRCAQRGLDLAAAFADFPHLVDSVKWQSQSASPPHCCLTRGVRRSWMCPQRCPLCCTSGVSPPADTEGWSDGHLTGRLSTRASKRSCALRWRGFTRIERMSHTSTC